MCTNRDKKDPDGKEHTLKFLETGVMTINTVVDKKAFVIIHTVTGEMTFEEIKSSYESVCAHPNFKENMTPIQLLLVDDEHAFVEIMKQKSSKHGWGRTSPSETRTE